MKPGTLLIVEKLSKPKSQAIAAEQWSDLVDDVLSLGREEFLRAVLTPKAPKPKAAATGRARSDPLVQKIERYRKKSGLTSRDFLHELHTRLNAQLPTAPPQSALASMPKFVTFARRSITDSEIEAVCASITDAFS